MAYRYVEETFNRRECIRSFKKSLRGKVSDYGIRKLALKSDTLSDTDLLKYVGYVYRTKFYDASSDYNKGDKVISHMMQTKSRANTFDLRSIFKRFDADDINEYIDFLDKLLYISYDKDEEYIDRTNAVNLAINSKDFLSIKNLQNQFRLLYEIVVSKDKEITSKLAIKEGLRFDGKIDDLAYILRNIKEVINYLFVYADVYTPEDLMNVELSCVPVKKLKK